MLTRPLAYVLIAARRGWPSRLNPENVAAMIDVQDMNFMAFAVNAISDPVFAASCLPQSLKRCLSGRSDAAMPLQQRTANELPCGERSRRRQALVSARLAPGANTNRYGPGSAARSSGSASSCGPFTCLPLCHEDGHLLGGRRLAARGRSLSLTNPGHRFWIG